MRGFILHIIVVDTVKEPIFFTKISCEKIPQSSSKKSKKWIWKFHVKNEEIILKMLLIKLIKYVLYLKHGGKTFFTNIQMKISFLSAKGFAHVTWRLQVDKNNTIWQSVTNQNC